MLFLDMVLLSHGEPELFCYKRYKIFKKLENENKLQISNCCDFRVISLHLFCVFTTQFDTSRCSAGNPLGNRVQAQEIQQRQIFGIAQRILHE